MKSIYRTLMNEALDVPLTGLKGRVLDVASGRSPSYHRFLSRPEVELSRADRDADGTPTVDFDKPLPYKDGEFDAVLCVNALYISSDPTATIKEMRRVTRRGGSVHVVAPFVMPEAREPHDYVRWTSEGLEELFRASGFAAVELTPFGGHFTSALFIVEPFLLFRPLKWLAHGCARTVDALVPRRYRQTHPCPLGYLVTAVR